MLRRIFLAAQLGALYLQLVPASASLLVLLAGFVAGIISLDGVCCGWLAECHPALARTGGRYRPCSGKKSSRDLVGGAGDFLFVLAIEAARVHLAGDSGVDHAGDNLSARPN